MTRAGSFVAVDGGDALPAVGSRWYWIGQHWEVEALTHAEGQPAVRLRLLSAPAKHPRHTKPWSLFARRAIPSTLGGTQ